MRRVWSANRGFRLLLLTIAASAVAYARTAVSPLQEAMRVALSLNDYQMALLQGPAFALPVVLAAVPMGLLIDRYSRVRLLSIFAVLDVVGSALTALASNFAMLFLARCLVGLTATASSSTAFSLLADWYEPTHRGRATMVVGVGQYGGFSAAFAAGGVLLAMSSSGPNSWRWIMLWLTSPLVLVVLVTLALREPPRTGRVTANPSVRQALTELWCYRAVLAPLLAGGVMVEIGILAVLTWGAPMLARNFALSPERIGAIMAMVILISGVIGSIAGGVLADVWQRGGGPRRTITALGGLAFLNVPTGLFAFASEAALATALLIVFATMGNAILTAGSALLSIVIPNELRGLCIAVTAAVGVFLGLGLAPLAVSTLSSMIGGPEMLGAALSLVCVLTGILGATAYWFGRRYFPSAA